MLSPSVLRLPRIFLNLALHQKISPSEPTTTTGYLYLSRKSALKPLMRFAVLFTMALIYLRNQMENASVIIVATVAARSSI